jgi:hypothetical protein
MCPDQGHQSEPLILGQFRPTHPHPEEHDMSAQIFNAPTEGISPEQLAAWQRQLDGTPEQKAQRTGFRPAGMVAKLEEVTIQNGVITSAKSTAKSQSGIKTVYATPTEPGFIQLPGGGKTTVEAAKAGGLVPHTWNEGDPLPFDQAPKGAPTDAPKDTQDGSPDATHLEHLAKLAGEVLQGVWIRSTGRRSTDALVDRGGPHRRPGLHSLTGCPTGVCPVPTSSRSWRATSAQAE